MRFPRLIISGLLLYEKLLIGASPILSAIYPSDSAASPFTGGAKIDILSAPDADIGPGQPVLENRGAAGPVGGGTLSQQSQPPQQPANTAPCTMLMGDVRQPDALSTGSTLYAKSTIAYSQMNDATTPDGEASATTAQEASSSAVGMPSLNVVGLISSEVILGATSTSPSIAGSTWGPSIVIPANNDASQDWNTPPATPLYPTTTMVTVPTTVPTVWTEMGCQKGTTGSRLRRQAGNDISCDPAGPSPDPHSSPPETSCSSTSTTGTSNSSTSSTSSPVSSDPIPPFPPLWQWIQFALIAIVVVMIIGVGACVYALCQSVRRNSLQWSESSMQPYIGRTTVLIFPGDGRKLEPECKPRRLMLSWRNLVSVISFALHRREKEPGGR